MSHSTAVATGAISDDWSAVFMSDLDGWRFQQWLSRLFVGDGQFEPHIAPEHLAMRFHSFDAAVAFFRLQYGPR